MSVNTITALMILITLALAGIVDIMAYSRTPIGETVSEVLWRWSTRYPILPLAVGILLGHLFWPLRILSDLP